MEVDPPRDLAHAIGRPGHVTAWAAITSPLRPELDQTQANHQEYHLIIVASLPAALNYDMKFQKIDIIKIESYNFL
jgi:hypothetical protein